MTRNLIAELIKAGVQPNLVAKTVAETINVSEKTARNKINCVTEFTLPEAVKINSTWFEGKKDLSYLFEDVPSTVSA